MEESQRFFKVIMPDCLTKLPLPPAFCEQLKDERSEEKAHITCCERRWRIRVTTSSDGLLRFEDGWDDFVNRLEIDVGNFVVFEHHGNLNFDAIVFDSTACQKDVPDSANFSIKMKMKSKRISSDEEAQKRRKKVHFRGWEKAMEAAESYSTDKPHFIKTISLSSGPYGLSYLLIPTEFVNEHNLEQASVIILRESTGKLWPVKICTRDVKSKRTGAILKRTTMRKGWREFYVAKDLKDGDVCLFELDVCNEKSLKIVMDVHIFPSQT